MEEWSFKEMFPFNNVQLVILQHRLYLFVT